MQIKSLEGNNGNQDLTLLVRDGPFVAEVAWVGHGLQSWLQIVWFLSRTDRNSSVILDEPDIYLHADLQRKLIKILKNRYPQVIVATHSVEIMSDVDPDNILIIDKNAKSSRFANSIPGVQDVIDRIGGVHNLQLSRLWAARRCLFVEGKDMALLSIFQSLMFPDIEDPVDTIPYISLGGWGNWRHAIGATIGLRNAGDTAIKTYCILDSDYKTQEEKDELKYQARRHGLQIHIWKSKEIENYLLVADLIHRHISKRGRKQKPRLETVVSEMHKICDEMREDITDSIATEILAKDRSFSLAKANIAARDAVGKEWGDIGGKFALVSGKMMLSKISSWSQREYKVSISALSLAREMRSCELDEEVRHVISCISETKDF